MSKQRSPKLKADATLAAEVSNFITHSYESPDTEALIFEEFSDQDINLEKWDNVSPVKDKTIAGQPVILYEDPHDVRLPPGIIAYEWKRPSEIYPHANFVVFTQRSTYPDLITPNRHILSSEFYRNLISDIEMLLYIGSTKPFPQEYGSLAFYATDKRPWRPWHNVYSNCKITKGEHSPMYNSAGKYVVRLFWLGTWRKVYIDDSIPLDMSGKVLVPSLHIPKLEIGNSLEANLVKKTVKGQSKAGSPTRNESIELWPIIICKGVLKLASLFRTADAYQDFDIINCLTGWVPQRIKTKDIPADDLWDIFAAYVDRFEYAENKEGSAKKTGSTKTKLKAKGKTNKTKKGTTEVIPSGIEHMPEGERFVVLCCNTFGILNETEILEPQTINIFLSEIRTVPLVQPPPRPELEFWKTFRYEQWAVEQGIIPPDLNKLNIRSLKIIHPFKRILDGTEVTDQAIGLEFPSQDGDNTDKKSEKSSKSSKKTPKGGKISQLEPDPSIWTDFSDIRETIGYITIYFQPRTFKAKAKISDINFENKTLEFHHLISPVTLKETRNEPLYLFMDSIDYKFLVINLAQMGNVSMLQKVKEEPTVDINQEAFGDMDICENILLTKTKITEASKSFSETKHKLSVYDGLKNEPVSLVLEEYYWASNSLGQPRATINTCGMKSLIMDLKPGRTSFRLWISSHCSYVIQLFSDMPFTVGSLEEYLTACSAESQLLTNLCYEISSCYGKLTQSFGMPGYSICLRDFYHSYKPIEHLSKRELAIVHRVFFEEFCKIISENIALPGVLDAVKLLFLQLKTFDYINPYTEEPHLYPDKFVQEEQVEYAKIMQRAAVKIQAFFKRIYIKSLLNKMHETHKQYNSIFEMLNKVYTEIFCSSKRLNYCPILVRRFFERQEMEELRNKFEIFRDTLSVLELYVCNGTLISNESSWVPICRHVFQINSSEPICIKVNLFCNMMMYTLRVFDNGTFKETNRIVNDVTTDKYHMNLKGYSVLSYGWCDISTKVNWKLVLVSKKMSTNDRIFLCCVPPKRLTLKGQYMPNFANVASRHVIKIGSDSRLTVSVTTSFSQVHLCLRLLSKEGKIIQEAFGVRCVILPIIDLRYNEYRSESLDDPDENIQGQRNSNQSGSELSDITYSKSSKKHAITDSERSSMKRTRKQATLGNIDKDDEVEFGSQRSYHDTDGKSRKSQGRVSSRVSLNTRLKSTSRGVAANTLNKVKESFSTEYILEALVIGNSWPLTADEWARVRKMEEQTYLNLLDERRVSSVSSKKLSTPKKGLASLALEEPYWILDVLYDSANYLEIEEDNSQMEIRREIKTNWFSNIERYARALKIREVYLQNHSVLKTDISNDRTVRSNNPKDFAAVYVKAEPLEKYFIKSPDEVDEDFCKTKREDDYIIEEANVERKIKEYVADEYAIQEDIEGQLQEQNENFEILSKWFEEIRADSMQMLSEAKAMERECAMQILQTSTKIKTNRSNKEKRKKQK